MADDLYGMLFNNLTPERKLLAAITNNMADSVRALIESHGPALLNAPLQTETRRTALHMACQLYRAELVARLAAGGADVTARDLFGLTPLDIALRRCCTKSVRTLLEYDPRPCTARCIGNPAPEADFFDEPGISPDGREFPAECPGELVLVEKWVQARVANETLVRLVAVALTGAGVRFVEMCQDHMTAEMFVAFLRFYLMTGSTLPPQQLSTVWITC